MHGLREENWNISRERRGEISRMIWKKERTECEIKDKKYLSQRTSTGFDDSYNYISSLSVQSILYFFSRIRRRRKSTTHTHTHCLLLPLLVLFNNWMNQFVCVAIPSFFLPSSSSLFSLKCCRMSSETCNVNNNNIFFPSLFVNSFSGF